ncbi:MAG: hypothetical protein QNJ51_16470 [Calothrix sp. MO_167.B12]|nr:hypothetical protein [Calothrix sp. MO_167.B12]
MQNICWKTLPIGLQVFSSTFLIQQKVYAQKQQSNFSTLNKTTTRDKHLPTIDVNISNYQCKFFKPHTPKGIALFTLEIA